MKKFLAVVLAASMVFTLAACDSSKPSAEPTKAATVEATVEPTVEPTAEVNPHTDVNYKSEGVMTYAEYAAAELESEVVIETFVQAKQGWWQDQITVYTQDRDGAYLLYKLACSEEDAAKLVPGTKIRVKGFKTAWSGEVEVAEGATYEIIEGAVSYIADPVDVTDKLASADIENYMNQKVSFTGMEVVTSSNGEAFMYNWDGSGSHDSNSDLYFSVMKDGAVYQFTVESYLCGNDTDVYAAVEGLKVGDVIDMEGFLYWYNGINPHITSVKAVSSAASKEVKSEGVMTYDEYLAAAVDDAVVIETYVQGNQSWWQDQITVYTQDRDGAYLLYKLACSEEDAAKLVPGTKLKVTGYKGEWAGEIEVAENATFEIVDGDTYIASPVDVTALLGSDALATKMNQKVSFSGLTVAAREDGAAFNYGWDGSGSHDSNSDLYFDVEKDGQVYTFTVESYLCGNDTEVYAAVEGLKVGDVIDCEGFLYWYNGANPHITGVIVK